MKKTFNIQGMHCRSCEVLISDGLNGLMGIKQSKVQPGIVEVEYDESLVNEKQIIKKLRVKDLR